MPPRASFDELETKSRRVRSSVTAAVLVRVDVSDKVLAVLQRVSVCRTGQPGRPRESRPALGPWCAIRQPDRGTDVRDRLRGAYMVLHVIRPEELPPALQPHLEWVYEPLTLQEPRYCGDGKSDATLAHIRRSTGEKIAEPILDIFSWIRSWQFVRMSSRPKVYGARAAANKRLAALRPAAAPEDPPWPSESWLRFLVGSKAVARRGAWRGGRQPGNVS